MTGHASSANRGYVFFRVLGLGMLGCIGTYGKMKQASAPPHQNPLLGIRVFRVYQSINSSSCGVCLTVVTVRRLWVEGSGSIYSNEFLLWLHVCTGLTPASICGDMRIRFC